MTGTAGLAGSKSVAEIPIMEIRMQESVTDESDGTSMIQHISTVVSSNLIRQACEVRQRPQTQQGINSCYSQHEIHIAQPHCGAPNAKATGNHPCSPRTGGLSSALTNGGEAQPLNLGAAEIKSSNGGEQLATLNRSSRRVS
jgi:hypothetical protein